MKKWLMGIVISMMAIGLAACSPTTETQRQKGANETIDPAMMPTTGGASDKIPDPTALPETVISVFHANATDVGILQAMDSIPGEELEAQALVDKLIEYKVLTSGTEVLEFTVDERSGEAVLDLNKAETNEDSSDEALLTEIGNTFISNYELSSLKVKVNGENFAGEEIQQGDSDVLTYREDLSKLE